MTLPTYGQLSTSSIAGHLFGNSGSSVSTGDASVQRFVKKQSGISIPGDFYGKGWGQQMNDLAPNAYNQGNSTNMKTHLMDRRSDGNGNQQYHNVALDSSKSWYGGIYAANSISNTMGPRDVGFNGYYYIANPNLIGSYDLNGRIDYELDWQFGPSGCRASMNLIGFSMGYLAGARKTLASRFSDKTSSGYWMLYGTFEYGYRHICVNLSMWQGGQGTSVARMWNGSAS